MLISIFLLVTSLSLITLMLQRHHLLMCLLSLEAALLSLAFLSGVALSSLNSANMFFCITILTLGACEAALALAILVNVSRMSGSDMIKSINMNKC